MFFHSHATTLPCESPFTLSHNQPGAETCLQHLYTWLVDVIMYKSSIQRIHSSRKCNYSLSFNHIPQAHCHTSTLPTRYTEISCCFYMFNRPLHAYNAFTVPPHHCVTLPTTLPTDTSIHVMYRLTQRATPPTQYHPLPLTIIIKYHHFWHISLPPKRGYY